VGILLFLTALGCVFWLSIWLAKTSLGRQRLLLWAGVATFAIGALTFMAVAFLPRATFGELGHGDGMGLMGLMMLSAILMSASLVLLSFLSAIIFVGRSRRAKLPRE
jgi:hypothetical protein